MTRDATVDIAKGLAILLMVQGNVAAASFHGSPGFVLKAYIFLASFVPALFIAAAGIMVVYTATSRGRGARHFFVRALSLLAAAAVIIDVLAWRIVPFVTVDVLYLIALSLPVAYGYRRLPRSVRWAGVVIIFVATPLLQRVVGYDAMIVEIPLGELTAGGSLPLRSILGQWIVDGWFPLFPWIGFALLGVNLGLMRWHDGRLHSFARRGTVLWGVGLLVAGAVLWGLYDGPLYARQGFSEKIYPPTLGYLVFATGEIILLLALFDARPDVRVYGALKACSEAALFIYLFHHVIMLVAPQVGGDAGALTVLSYPVVVAVATAYLLRWIRRRWPGRPALLRSVLGI